MEARIETEDTTLQAIFGQAAIGIAQIGLDGSWLRVNGRYCQMLGYSESELRAKSICDMTHPDDCNEVLAGRRQLLEGAIASHSMEKRYIRKDGTVFWGRLNRSLVRDNDNLPKFFIAVIEDITDRVQAERALRENEQHLKNAERLAHIGHFHWDLRSNTVSGSEEMYRIFGQPQSYTPSHEDFMRMLVPRDRERVASTIRDAIEKKMIRNLEYQISTPNGDLRTIACTLEVSLDEDGLPVRLFGACQDITDSRRAREEGLARQKLEDLGVLAHGIAHDFNNLLGSILAEAGLAEAELAAGLTPHEEIAGIQTVAIHGAEIVRQLMIYAGQDQTGVFEPVDLSRLTAEMLELIKISISKHALLKSDLDKDVPAVLGNAQQIRQVLMNLVINASEAIGDKEGVIQVTTSSVRGYVRLEVSDTGCGITEVAKTKIFDPFFTTKFAGRGLGLAVVQGIVRAHGGAIDVVSVPGQGATFQVLLPCTSEVPDALMSPEAEQSNAWTGTGRTVLVVEDEEVLRLAVSKALRRRGFSVMEAEDGSVAIDLMRTHRDDIDVILLDVTIPGISSKEVFEEALRLRANLKVIVTSAYDQKTIDAFFSGLRIRHFIRKPFRLDDLADSLRDALTG